jgi:hypothetical protein
MFQAAQEEKLGLVCAEHLDAWRELLQGRMRDIRNEWDGVPVDGSGSDSEPIAPPAAKKRVGTLKLHNATTTQHHRGGSSLSGAAAPVHAGLEIDLGINLPTRDAEPRLPTGDHGQSGKWLLDPFACHPVSTFIANL